MPAVIISGITAILSGLFQLFVNQFLIFFTKRFAYKLAVVSLFLTMTGAFILTLKGLYTGISYVMPSEITIAAGWFLPSNANLCLSAVLAAYTARYVYDVNRKVFSLFANL